MKQPDNLPASKQEMANVAFVMLFQNLTNAELKLAEKNCDWVAFKHAFNAVIKRRKAAWLELYGLPPFC